MGDEKHDQNAHEGDFVLSRVLAAEATAETRVRDARKMAQSRLQITRSKEREIAARAERRIQALHDAGRDRLAKAQRELQAGFEADQQGEKPGRNSAHVSAAVKRLATQLTGAAPK